MSEVLKMSGLRKTWIFDLDGTLVKHNGYKIDGQDSLLDGVEEFFLSLNELDFVLIITARSSDYKEQTLAFLRDNNIRYNQVIFDAPHGERILLNDKKPSGMLTAYSFNQQRDVFKAIDYEVDENI